MVLLYNFRYKKNCSINRKLNFQQLGLYLVVGVNYNKGNYFLFKLNKLFKAGTVLGHRLKLYKKRGSLYIVIPGLTRDPLRKK